MKRAVFSFGVAGLLVSLLLASLLSAGETLGSIIATLLAPGFFVSFAGKWFGLDCATADSMKASFACLSIMLIADWFIYAALFYGVSFLFWHPPREAVLDSEQNIAGTTIGIN